MRTAYSNSLHTKALDILEAVERCDKNIGILKHDLQGYKNMGFTDTAWYDFEISKHARLKRMLLRNYSDLTVKIYAARITDEVSEQMNNKINQPQTA